MLTFVVPGDPVAKARPRVVRAGKFTRTFTPQKSIDFENRVRFAAEAAGATPVEGPVELEVLLLFACPKSRHRKRTPRPEEPRTQKPDWDNCAKAVADALNGIAYTDDSQITDARVRKRTAAQGELARTIVTVRALHERPSEKRTEVSG